MIDLATGLITGTIGSINDAKQQRRQNLLQNYYAAKGINTGAKEDPDEAKKILGLSMPVFIALAAVIVVIVVILIVFALKAKKS